MYECLYSERKGNEGNKAIYLSMFFKPCTRVTSACLAPDTTPREELFTILFIHFYNSDIFSEIRRWFDYHILLFNCNLHCCMEHVVRPGNKRSKVSVIVVSRNK